VDLSLLKPFVPARAARWTALALLAAAALAAGQTGTLEALVVTPDGQPVTDAVVVAVPVDAAALAGGRPHNEIVDQVDKEFVPHVKPVFVGSTVTFPNKDNVRHHVYSFSPAKRFELPLYSGVPAQPVMFDKPGVVVLGCNIHDWMVGYIYVSESPWFAKTNADGRATLALPPRAYVVRVWHPQLVADEASTRKPVDVAQGATARAQWSVEIKPEVRVRRTPGGGHGSHY
jgi:plastocyanin